MGISNLKNILSCIDKISKIEDKDSLKKYFDKSQPENMNIHIDYSVLIYKKIFSKESENNLNKAYSSIVYFLKEIQKKNTLYIYIDPKDINRKRNLQIERRNAFQKNFERKENFITSNKINDSLKELIEKNDDQPSTSKQAIENLKLENLHIHEYDVEKYKKFVKKLKKQEKNQENYEVFLEYIDKNFSDDYYIQEYFLLYFNITFHKKWILKKLKEENIISRENIIKSDIDAELEIFRNIFLKKKENNLIFTSDQDAILFGTLTSTSTLYIQEQFHNSFMFMNIIKNDILTKNISILVLFFNKSDYFPGIFQFPITEKKIKIMINDTNMLKYLSETELSFDYSKTRKKFKIRKIDIIKLIKTTINYFITQNNKKKPIKTITDTMAEEMYLYCIDFVKYIIIDNEFFQEERTTKRFNLFEWYYFLNEWVEYNP